MTIFTVPTLIEIVELALGLYLIAVLMGILGAGSRTAARASFVLGALASMIMLLIPLSYLFGSVRELWFEIPFIGAAIPIHIDALSAVLIFVIAVLSLASSIYSVSYMDYYSELGAFGVFAALFNLFTLSMLMVVIVDSALWFLFAWEVMTLASYFLINWEYTEESVRRAAWKYFVSMHFLSTLPLIVAIAIIINVLGTDSLSQARAVSSMLDPSILAILYVLFLVGFGAKAGAVPLHFWLPDAHPAAPSNVSALLSGAMIKVAVYGLLRFCAYVLPPNYVFGIAVALIGTLSLTIGTLTALKQTDAKRLLAYHSVGQMGYIWLGIGTGIALACIGSPLALVGLVAGLYHLVNHAVFKGLLFLSAGSILYRTHTKNLNALGGLAKYMPITALFTLIAALSIAGVPPFNGFVSKWLIYESTFLSGNGILTFCGIMALFISAATLASFIKFYTSAFGGTPTIEEVREVPFPMILGMGILATLCVAMGVVPAFVVKILSEASSLIVPSVGVALRYGYAFVSVGESVFEPLILVAMLIASMCLGLALAMPKTSVVTPWSCGAVVEPRKFRMIAGQYYRAYEEYIHVLYEASHSLYQSMRSGVMTIGRILVVVSNVSASKISRIGSAIHRLGEAYLKHVKEVYIDEALAMPAIRIVHGLARFIAWTAMRTDIVTFLSYSALFILVVSIVVILVVVGIHGG